MADYEGASATVYGEHEKVDILRQLDRLLDNPHFSHSKRFPSFLRFIVQEELEGRGDQLKAGPYRFGDAGSKRTLRFFQQLMGYFHCNFARRLPKASVAIVP